MRENLVLVGLGPGSSAYRTPEADRALDECDVIVGYSAYFDLLEGRFAHKQTYATGMTGEVQRCQRAVDLARQGKKVAVICSGDPGVYGMAGLIFQLAKDTDLTIGVVAGVSAAMSGAALVGAPLGHDFAVISLSDRLTPWEVIERRLDCAAQGDFCISLYNPVSRGRPDHLKRACERLMNLLPADRPCAWAKNIARDGQSWGLCRLDQLAHVSLDMFSTCFIGNSCSTVIQGKLVTPRGYRGVESCVECG